ncbi:DegV family protein with EDD domain [Mobilisporobacter senegalensis]|uniref:DegV family protein with EDD domain n=1 Tax=Mobilisporobacter senegalensis TaxID=1329262 RepID=A0A3N1XNA3_9FIRM|nr:DegV family protein [Mobilisporobacter senegalensis]ROR28173.1 DegV family protein with EDD domain [Mobilisporobacter senegalensis]
MNYKIIGDSCTDLTADLKKDEHIELVPLSIHIDNETIVDDETFDQKEFIRKMEASPNCPKSSCPSPEAYMNAFSEEGDQYVVTLSSSLSGSYNSAELAKKLYLEEHPGRNIAVFDSKAASVAQTLIVMKIKEYIESGHPFEKVVEQINHFIEELNTKFVLESLETLRKNGRLSNLKAIIASALNIKPVMGATKEGTIYKIDQARGINKALKLMATTIVQDVIDPENKILGIAHCNNYERALYIKEEILKLVKFKSVFIADTAGIASLYANEGGIIVAY